MRLIDADALLKTLTVFDEKYTLQKSDVFHHIENAPTVQREGWVSVPIEPAIEQFKALGGNEEPEPIERLRFFCSLAMTNRNWLDVEPFFDDVITQLNTEKG